MGQPAAKQGDQITAVDQHVVMVPSPSGPTPTTLPHPFNGVISGNLSTDVRIEGRPAAMVGSTATNHPPHTPTPPGTSFQIPPTNQGRIIAGSGTVFINDKPAARADDQTQTCADPMSNTSGKVVVSSCTVMIGG